MGYDTRFEGRFEFDKDHPLSVKHARFLQRFNETRRMKRDPDLLPDDPFRKSVGLPPGLDGGYCVCTHVFIERGQSNDTSVRDYNRPPQGQPGLWCQWTVSDYIGTGEEWVLEWDQGEKFYHYVEWLEYLIKHFLGPWGYKLSGTVYWQGEAHDDMGRIRIEPGNKVVVERGRVVYSVAL